MTVCDCNKPNTRGLLDLTDPNYCGIQHTDYQKFYNMSVNYKIVTKQKHHLKFPGLTCSEWTQTKRITGSFWYWSYDTEHFHTTRAVTQDECWNMKQSQNCAGNKIIKNDKTYSFVQEPVGEGSWNSIKEYSIINCLAHEIILRQEEPNGLLVSPFGYHNVSITDGKFQYNHNTIVWDPPKTKNPLDCGTEVVVRGKSRLSQTKVDGKLFNRLLDNEKQMEVLFLSNVIEICPTILHSYKIIGIPNTFIWLNTPITKYFPERQKRTGPTVKFIADSDSIIHEGFIYSWGKIRLCNQNILSVEGNDLYLASPTAIGIPYPFKQEFEYTTNRTIRVEKSNLCISADKTTIVTLKPCANSQTRWLIDNVEHKIVEIDRFLCLTAAQKTVQLNHCSNSTYQTWRIENENNNTNFRSVNSIPSIEDLQYTQQELRSRETQAIQDIDKVYFWGQLINKRNKHSQTCLSNAPGTSVVEMKACLDNDSTQEFEYAKDFTIQKFGTNRCITITRNYASLKHCDKESMRFGKNLQTGQIIELESQLCIQHTQNVKMLHLGECGEDQTLRRQKWKFQYYNPEIDNSLAQPYLTNGKILSRLT